MPYIYGKLEKGIPSRVYMFKDKQDFFTSIF